MQLAKLLLLVSGQQLELVREQQLESRQLLQPQRQQRQQRSLAQRQVRRELLPRPVHSQQLAVAPLPSVERAWLVASVLLQQPLPHRQLSQLSDGPLAEQSLLGLVHGAFTS